MTDLAAFHRRALIADAHADSLMWNRDLNARSEEGHVDFARLADAGVKLQCFTLVTHGFPFVGGFPIFAARHGWPASARRSPWTRALWQIDRLEAFCRDSQGRAAIARVRSDLPRNLAEGRLSAVLGVEGAHALEGRAERVAELFRRGVRFIGLTHLSNNALGGSSFPLMGNRGLTPHGREVLDAMAALGMAVDVAHASRRTLAEVLEHPVTPFCSHTGVAACAGSWRNLDDAALRRIAEKRGVIAIIFGTVYLGGRAIADVVRHIEHALEVAGEDAVALGSDFDGMVPLPKGMRDVRDLPKLTEALLERGHPEARVEKVLGGNLFRFFGEVFPEAAR